MKSLIMILKGLLLYITAFSTVIFIACAEGLYEKNMLLESFIVLVLLIAACYEYISEDEAKQLILKKWVDDKY